MRFQNFQEVACSSLQYLESFQPPCNHGLTFFFRWAIAKVRMGKDPSRDRNQRNEWNVREIYFNIFKPDEEAVRSLVFETSLLFLWLIIIAFGHARASMHAFSMSFPCFWTCFTRPMKRGLNFIVAVELLAGLTEKQTLGGLKSLTDSWLKAMQFSCICL